MLKYRFLLVFILSFIYSNHIPVNHFQSFNNQYIDLILDPYYNTNYKLHKYFPHYNYDYEFDILKFDGSFNFPLNNMIPEEVYIENVDSIGDSKSQITIYQDQEIKFYNTSVAYKAMPLKNTEYFGIVESKSIQNNINQNYFMSMFSKKDNSVLKTSYMYHYEDIPIHPYAESPGYNRVNESFIGGLFIDYIQSKFKIQTQVNFQFSNTERYDEMEGLTMYDNHVYWAGINLEYIFNEKFSLYSTIYCKNNSNDLLPNQLLDSQLNDLRVGINYQNGNFTVTSNLVNIQDYLTDIDLSMFYRFNRFRFGVSRYNDVYINISEINHFSNDKFSFELELDRFNQMLNIGKIKSNLYDYYYMNFGGKLSIHSLIFEYDIGFFDNENLMIRNYANYSVTFSPKIKDKPFRPYVKVLGNYLQVNDNYNLSNYTSNIFSFPSIDNEITYNTINFITGEIGLMFDTFKLSFVQRNLLNENIFFSINDYPIYPVNYIISIVWTFED